ncbi:MAG: hypothetical protein B0W54_23965 [Cellvibrio sp. 79]|nr:MAG: hypothetical protein B0W54_23965 [Cellvibrio sp. 79]
MVAIAFYFWDVKKPTELLAPAHEVASPIPVSINSGELINAEKALAEANKALAPQTTDSKPTEAPMAAGESTPAWRIAHKETVSMPVPNGVAIYEPVSVDMDSPAYPSPGEQVSLQLPDGETVKATVKSSNENPNGDYSWRGHLDGYGTDYPVVMTYGATSVFATITTPKGSYTLESINGSGWVYKNPSEFELSDPGKNDYLDIPHEHDHE